MKKIDERKRKALKKIKKDIGKTYGGDHLISGDEIEFNSKISAGCMQLDIITGGGYNIGSTNMFWGWEGTGKTTAALMAAAEAQDMCVQCQTRIKPEFLLEPETEDAKEKWRSKRLHCIHCGAPYHKDERSPCKVADFYDDVPDGVNKGDLICEECGEVDCIEPLSEDKEYARLDSRETCECGECEPNLVLWLDYERSFDREWAEAIGVDMDLLLLEKPMYGEAGLDVVDSTIEEGIVGAIVIDSVANISSSEEMGQSHEKMTVGKTARLFNKFMRKLPSKLEGAYVEYGIEPTVFLVNQIREKVGVAFGSPDTMFGGHGQKFGSSTTLKFTSYKTEVDKKAVGAKSRKEFVGLTASSAIRVQCSKNKTAPTDGMKTEFRLIPSDQNEGGMTIKKGDVYDYDVIWKYGRATKTISKDLSPGNDWDVVDWPLKYSKKGELMLDLHNRHHLRRHLRGVISQRVKEEYARLKEDM